jgi:chromosome segregation ATPase
MSTDEETTNPTPGEPELGDAGKRAIQAERDRATQAERELRAIKAQYETATARLAELEAQTTELASTVTEKDKAIARLNVGIDKGLPKNLIARLQGDDEEALTADAEALLEFLPTDTKQTLFPPKADPSQGAKGETGTRDTAHQFAAAVEEAFTN